MKRKVPHHNYLFLKSELNLLEAEGHLDEGEADRLIGHYTTESLEGEKSHKPLNYIRIFSVIGAILIGLGLLSFVATGWSALGDITKFVILLLFLISTYIVAWSLEEKKPIISRSLYYIGLFSYGAEIIYIGQLFHLGGDPSNAVLLWALGAFPLAYYLKDKWVTGVALGFSYLFIEMKFMSISDGAISYWMLLIIPLLFLIRYYLFKKSLVLLIANFILVYQFIQFNFAFQSLEQGTFPFLLGLSIPILFVIGHKVMDKSTILFIVNTLISLQFITMAFYYFDVSVVLVYFLLIFLIGLAMYHYPFEDYKVGMKWLGFTLHVVFGLTLTFNLIWTEGFDKGLFVHDVPLGFIFGIGYLMYGLYRTYKNDLMGVLIVCVLVFRFYVDISLVFMNKSIAFILGGVLLLALGYWFEKKRRGGKNDAY